MNTFRFIKLALIVLLSTFVYTNSYAQLKKSAEIEKIKSFTNGSVTLSKVLIDGVDFYCVSLKNNSQYYNSVIFYIGDEKGMITNLQDLSKALNDGKKGDVFDFSACGKDYQLSFSKVMGQECFKVREPINTSSDFGRFYKATIDDILDYMTSK